MNHKVYCSICGADITRTMKFYDNLVNRYCYDCFQVYQADRKAQKKVVKEPRKRSNRKLIRKLHSLGYKPSQIAEMTGHTRAEVYEALR